MRDLDTRTVGPEATFSHASPRVWAVVVASGPAAAAAQQLALAVVADHADTIRRAADDADASPASRRAVAQVLEDVMLRADTALGQRKGLSTTAGMLIAALGKDRLFLATVGPCAAFLSRAGRLERLTRDRSHEALGTPMPFDADIAELDLQKHDVVALCPRALGEDLLPDLLAGGDANAPMLVLEPGVEAREEAAATARVLDALFLFGGLTPQERLAVTPYLEYRIYAPGDVVMREGERGDEFMAIADGAVQISRRDTGLRRLVSGDHFGELALTGVGTRSATATVDAPTWVVVLSRPNFEALLDRRPEIGVKISLALLQTMGAWLDDLTHRVAAQDPAPDPPQR